MKEREKKILELLTEHERMDVSELSERLGVSQVTIRKDLIALEKRSVLRREHGYAILGHADDMNNRLSYHYEQKRRIAEAAAKLVKNGETIMIESGSCCALLAETVAKTLRGVTVITNSAFISNYIRHIDGCRVVLLGGDFQPDAQVMVGPIVRLCASQFHVDKLFIGVDGYTEERGFSGDDHLRVQAVRDMADSAENVYVITESAKFGRHGIAAMNPNKPVKCVVTDPDIPDVIREALTRNGTELITAERI